MRETARHEHDRGGLVTALAISADSARQLVGICVQQAQEARKHVCVAVCDGGGQLKAFMRMDGAPLLTIDIAQNKAYTAVAFGMSTDAWHDTVKGDPPLAMGIAHTPRLVVFGGGHPLYFEGELVGGLGVSGDTHYSEDMAFAREAITRMGYRDAQKSS